MPDPFIQIQVPYHFIVPSTYFVVAQARMGLYTTPPPDLDEVDIIIVGGGSAGCIVAGRLAAADPNLSILLIEGGRNNRDVTTIVNPLFMMKNLAPATKAALYYKGSKCAHVADREAIVPAGGILGGGSSINFMLWVFVARPAFPTLLCH